MHVLFAIVLGLVVSGCQPAGPTPSHTAVLPMVRAHAVTRRHDKVELSVHGEIMPTRTAQISANAAGHLTRVAFEPGTQVHAGQVVARVDARPYVLARQQATAQLAKATVALNVAQQRLARRAKARKTSLSLVSEEAWEEASHAADMARAERDGAMVNLREAEHNLAQTAIRSPCKGVVQQRRAELGTYVQPGHAIGEVARPHRARVRFFVASEVASRVLLQQTVQVRPWGEEDTGAAVITYIAANADVASKQVEMHATLTKQARFWPNAHVRVALEVPPPGHAWLVSRDALLTGERGVAVYVLHKDCHVEFRNVVTAVGNGSDVWILRGVAEGERVVVQGSETLTDGAQVQIESENQS